MIPYLILINAISLLLMLTDKRHAQQHNCRIPEAVLFGTAMLGGSIGGVIGMFGFRHKTRRPLFVIGFPVLMILHVFFLLQ